MARLERTFDRRAKAVKQELAEFQEEVADFERRHAPAAILTRTKREGPLLHLSVMSAKPSHGPKPASPAGSWVEAWKP